MSDEVLYEQRGAAAWLTLNRPDKRNALNGAVIQGLREGLRRAHADDSVRAIVLTGAGDKAFCAGADLQPGVGFVFDPAIRDARNERSPETDEGLAAFKEKRKPSWYL